MKWPRFPLAHRKNRKYPFPLEEYEEDDLAVAVVVAGHLGQAVVQGAEERSMQSGTPRGVDYRPFTRRTLLHKRKLNHFKRRIRRLLRMLAILAFVCLFFFEKTKKNKNSKSPL